MGGHGSGRRRDKAGDRDAVELRDRRLSLSEIGERLGLTQQAVSVILDRQGYGAPPKKPRRHPPRPRPLHGRRDPRRVRGL